MGNVLTSYFAENCYQRGFEEGTEQRRRAELEPLQHRAIAIAAAKAELSPYDAELVRELRDEPRLVALVHALEGAAASADVTALIEHAFEDERRVADDPLASTTRDGAATTSRAHEHARRCSQLGQLYGERFAEGFVDGLAGDSQATPDPPTARAIIHHVQRRLETLGRRPWRVPEAEGLIALLAVVEDVVASPAIARRARRG